MNTTSFSATQAAAEASNGPQPLDAIRAVDAAFSRGDIEGVLDFYEDEATMVVRPGLLATGKTALRTAYEAIFASFAQPPSVIQERSEVLRSGDLALFVSRWRLTGRGARGEAINQVAHATSVLRRQSDGRWRAVIDNGLGIEILD
jgi:uncharacterized protein (TIGR02246 family)